MKLEDMLKNTTLKHFYKISKIPRGSGNEEEISNYIYNWALSKGLYANQDSYNNLIIKKENNSSKNPIILQAHLDMVCEKNVNSNHDFLKDPIDWSIVDNYIKASNGTTLGADCGIGVALIMTMLEKENENFPPIEAIFTTREETDLAGAYNINTNLINSDRIINLDISPENKILLGSSGGFACEANLDVNFEDYGGQTFEINLFNMHGGHSGHDINKGYGNPIILITDLYNRIKDTGVDCRLVSIEGGNSRLAIPREASLKFCSKDLQIDEIINPIVSNFSNYMYRKFSNCSNNIKLTLNKIYNHKVLSEKDEFRLIELIELIPNGINEMDSRFDGLVESSSNLGIVKFINEQISLIEEIRFVYKESGEQILNKIEALSRIYNFHIKVHSKYPSWISSKKSNLCQKTIDIYKSLYNSEPIVTASHSGNEVAILMESLNLTDAIAIGPTRQYYHTPNEILDCRSAINFEKYLECILKEI